MQHITSTLHHSLAIVWLMKQTISDRPRGIQWILLSQLEDLDFTDDLAVISTTIIHLQEKSSRLNNFANDFGLQRNKDKTNVMNINTSATTPITISEGDLKYFEDFTLYWQCHQQRCPQRYKGTTEQSERSFQQTPSNLEEKELRYQNQAEVLQQ